MSVGKIDPPFEILAPREWTAPAIFNSPHSGRSYPDSLLRMTKLSPVALRKSEDCFIDELFAPCIDLGAPMLRALVPRAFIDLNREAYEFDPRMFESELPGYMNTTSPRVAGGLGTIPRLVAEGEEIYRGRLTLADGLDRVETVYRPYHRALKALLDEVMAKVGAVLLLDCHSMPSNAAGTPGQSRAAQVDVVVGDRYGAACPEHITQYLEGLFRDQGLTVARNTPYAGGFITQNYGSSKLGQNALQIEINRALYLDERSFRKNRYFGDMQGLLANVMRALLAALSDFANPVKQAAE
jgi:N-formylglutamate amidohydrolase